MLETLSTGALENGNEARISTNLVRCGYLGSLVGVLASLTIF
jgi:hypothetical protein